MDVNEKWYSVKEFAALFSVSRDTVARWIQKGLVKALRFPSNSSRRVRKNVSYRISESERQHLIRLWATE
jgi:excisionase family DNA binding protein